MKQRSLAVNELRSAKTMIGLFLCAMTLLLQSGCAYEMEGNEREFFTGHWFHAKPTPAPRPVAATVQPVNPPSVAVWKNTNVVSRAFPNLDELSKFCAARGFILMGRFIHSQWPVKVVSIQDATNEISFRLKSGQAETYSGFTGFHLKAVRLEDNVGGETMVVLRSKEIIAP